MWQFSHVRGDGNGVAGLRWAGITLWTVAKPQRLSHLTQIRNENRSPLAFFIKKLMSVWSQAGKGRGGGGIALVFRALYEWFSWGKVSHRPCHSQQTTSVPLFVDMEEHDSPICLKGKKATLICLLMFQGEKMACKSCLPASKRCVSLFIISLHLTCSSGSKMIIQHVNHFKEKKKPSIISHSSAPSCSNPFSLATKNNRRKNI